MRVSECSLYSVCIFMCVGDGVLYGFRYPHCIKTFNYCLPKYADKHTKEFVHSYPM